MTRQSLAASSLSGDILGRDELFDEAEHFQRIFNSQAGQALTRYRGTLAPGTIDLLRIIVGEGDVGIVVAAIYGNGDSYVVLRVRDWEAVERRLAK
jgi:hypothetical protein